MSFPAGGGGGWTRGQSFIWSNRVCSTTQEGMVFRVSSLKQGMQRRASTESGPFSIIICLDASKLVLLSAFTLIEKICPNICSKSCLKGTKNPLPVEVRRSKTSFLKLQISLFSVLNIVYFCTDSLLVEKRNGWRWAIYVW